MSAIGPLARTAADLRTALRVTAGPEEPAAKALSWVLPPPRQQQLNAFRAGVVLDDPRSPVTAETGAVLSNAVDALARAGVTVVEDWPKGTEPQIAESFGFQVGLFFAFQDPGVHDFGPHCRRLLSRNDGEWLPGPPGRPISTMSTSSCAR